VIALDSFKFEKKLFKSLFLEVLQMAFVIFTKDTEIKTHFWKILQY